MSLHSQMQNNFGWYTNWHNHPKRSLHHFVIFIFFTVIVFSGLIVEINNPVYSDSGEVSLQKSTTHQLTGQLFKAIKIYDQASANDKELRFQELSNIVNKRKIALTAEIKNNQEKALLNLLPQSALENMPPEVQNILEKHISIAGKLNLDIIENGETNYSEDVYTINDTKSNKEYRLHFANGEPKLKIGAITKTTGVELAGNLIINTSDSGSLTQTVEAYAGEPASTLRTLVILVNFSDNKTQPYTPAQVAGFVFTNPLSVNEYYKSNSNGLTSFVGDVTQQYITLPNTGSYYCTNYRIMATEAQNAVAQAGYALTNYDRIGILMPTSGCSWGGVSSVWPSTMNGYTTSIFQAYGSTNLVQLMIHEFGHALSLQHASTLSCGSKSIDTSTLCTANEYGDKYDPMGYYNNFHSNLPHSLQIPWMNTANIKTVSTNGTYSISPFTSVTGSTQGLKIYKKDTGDYYYIGYRQPVGLDAGLPSTQTSGVVIHKWASGGKTYNLDGTPGDGNFGNSALSDGASFTDTINGMTITQLSHSTSSVNVQVTFTAPVCAKYSPTLSISPVSQSASQGISLTYNLTLKNNDSTSCSTTNFNYSTVLPDGFTFSLTSPTVSVAPGSSNTSQVTISSPATQSDGSYQFSMSAKDTIDAAHGSTANGTYVVYSDNVGPTLKITSPIDGSVISGTSLSISATATDVSGISKVEFYFDESIKATNTSSPYTYKLNIRKVTAGLHTIKVRAYDKSGNTSETSVSVTVK